MIHTLERTASAATPADARATALIEQLEHLGENENWADATAMLLVDAILDWQVEPLETFLGRAAAHEERAAHEPVLEALASVAQWGIARLLPVASAREIDWDAAEGRILRFVAAQPDATGTQIYQSLGLAEATVSRLGNQLETDGLISRERAGKWLRWRLTPQGTRVLLVAQDAGLVSDDAQEAASAAVTTLLAGEAAASSAIDELLEINRRAGHPPGRV